MLDGVILTPLKIIPDERGSVMHMLRADAPHFRAFGEIYFSTVNPGVTKGWKEHTSAWGNIVVIHGRLRFVLCDRRDGSPTQGRFMDLELGPHNYHLLSIPPGIAYAWRNLGETPTILANCSSEAHRPGEGATLPFEDIAYDWEHS